jgi:hypothetical protein
MQCTTSANTLGAPAWVSSSVAGIDHHAGGHVELVARCVKAFAAPGPIRGVELAARADLQQQLSVRSVFLDGAVAVAGNPDVSFLIDETAVDRARDGGLIAPRSDHVAVGVELDDRGRGDRRLLFLVGDIAPVDHVDVVLRAGADAAKLAGDPALRQVLRPGGVHREFRRALGGQRGRSDHGGQSEQNVTAKSLHRSPHCLSDVILHRLHARRRGLRPFSGLRSAATRISCRRDRPLPSCAYW